MLVTWSLKAAEAPKSVTKSTVIDWAKLAVKPTKTGERRELFDAPTLTLNNFEGHVTTIRPGEVPHPPHRHPDEEMILIKEGTLEVTINGETQRASAGSIFFLRLQRSSRHAQRRLNTGHLLRVSFCDREDSSRRSSALRGCGNRVRE